MALIWGDAQSRMEREKKAYRKDFKSVGTLYKKLSNKLKKMKHRKELNSLKNNNNSKPSFSQNQSSAVFLFLSDECKVK